MISSGLQFRNYLITIDLYIFRFGVMAKGKHAPNPGAVKQQSKVLHPASRKLKKVHKAGVHRSNVDVKGKVGLQRMSALADKLIWVKENLPALVEEDGEVTNGNIFLIGMNLYLIS